MITYVKVIYIYQNLNIVTESQLKLYYLLGLIGMVLIFLYNIGFIVFQIIDIIIGFRFSNQ